MADVSSCTSCRYTGIRLPLRRRIRRRSTGDASAVSCLVRKHWNTRAKDLGLRIGKKCPAPGTTTSRELGRQSNNRSAVGRQCENFPNANNVGVEIVFKFEGTRNDS